MTVSSSKSKVCFFFEKKDFRLNNRTKLKSFLEGLFKKEGKKLDSLNYIFTSDKELLKINQDFLHHDDLTDIITFEYSPGDQTQGEIYISVARVKENAKLLKLPFSQELHRVIFHGALHLCGYKDKSKFHVKKMREREDYYLGKYFEST
jgi:probable rRNA maturation factor